MANNDFRETTTSQMRNAVPDFTVKSAKIDDVTGEQETYHYNENYEKYLGFYKTMPQIKQATDSFYMWAFGKGWEAEPHVKVRLQKIKGWGEDTFDSIMQNLGCTKGVNGDSYAEKVYDEASGELVNIKPLNPMNVRHVIGPNGIIKRYDVWNAVSGKWEHMNKNLIFHTCNGRIASEIHGTSKVESVVWIVEAKQEAMNDWRRILHRSTIRVLECDTDDAAKNAIIRAQYAEAIKWGEILLLPKQDGGKETKFQDLAPPPVETFLAWMRYLDSIFYKAFGTPEVILGGSAEYTEAGSKVGFLTFEVPYTTEQRDMEQDILSQLGFKITFNRPPSLQQEQQESEAANTGQTSFQPNEVTAQPGRVE